MASGTPLRGDPALHPSAPPSALSSSLPLFSTTFSLQFSPLTPFFLLPLF